MEGVVTRIKQFVDNQGISVRALESHIGASNGVISGALKKGKDIQSKWLSIIIDSYPLLNATWLLTGKGEMLNAEHSNQSTSIVAEDQATYSSKAPRARTEILAYLEQKVSELEERISEKDKEIGKLESYIQALQAELDCFRNGTASAVPGTAQE